MTHWKADVFRIHYFISNTNLIFICYHLTRLSCLIFSLEQLVEIVSHLSIAIGLAIIYVSKWICLLFLWLISSLLEILLMGLLFISNLIVLNLLLRSTKIEHILTLVIIYLLLTWIVVVVIVVKETQQVCIIRWSYSSLCRNLSWFRFFSFFNFYGHCWIPGSVHKWRLVVEI